MRQPVYNLEFRSGCHEMDIGGFRFSRVPAYPKRVRQLQHLVNVVSSECAVSVTTGGHVHTADVHFDRLQPGVLGSQPHSALDDVVLLLSLFTTRQVFALDADSDPLSRVIVADSRLFPWGGLLSTSIPCEQAPPSLDDLSPPDVSLGKELDAVYSRIRGEEWLAKYERGHFLFLAFAAFQQRFLPTAFILCWTIWEHLFSVFKRSAMTEKSIRNVSAKEKIAFILVAFGVRVGLEEQEKKRLGSLAEIRNRLVHFGCFPESSCIREHAEMFVRMTEFIIAKALGLQPSTVFNTLERFEEFLTAQTPQRPNATTP